MNAAQSRARLDTLLSEPIEAVRQREREALEQMAGGLDGDFALFGAGNLGRKVARTLKGIGRTPVAFIDNNPALWGGSLEGVPIMAPAELARRTDAASVGIVTTIWCGEATDRMSDRTTPLRKLGFRRIALFGHLAWRFPDVFLPHYCLDLPSKVLPQAERIVAAFERLADDESRALFVDHVEWRLFVDYDVLPPPSPEEIYFNAKFVDVAPGETLFDIGAYTGDSVASFLASARGRAFAGIHAFEPSPANFRTLAAYVAGLGPSATKVFAHPMALGDAEGTINVETQSGPAARVGRGTETVRMSTVDRFARDVARPTFLKIDIEGFEPQCLAGAQETIAGTAPVVAVCVYHVQAHLWDILLQLQGYRGDYRFHLCPHLADGWDLVLYAVPPHRHRR